MGLRQGLGYGFVVLVGHVVGSNQSCAAGVQLILDCSLHARLVGTQLPCGPL